MIFGFFVMGILAYRTYTASMPMPGKVVTQSGDVLFTGDEITRGQELFLARGLQEYGSILGHGAYLGPDYTADYLRMATDDVTAQFRAEGVSEPRDRVVQEFRTNRYDDATATLVFTDRQAAAFENIQRHYAAYFGENSTKYGLLPKFITDDAEIHDLTAFFAWTAWASAAERPGHDYTYTNNWPAEPRVDNGHRAADRMVDAVTGRVARRHHVRHLRTLEPEGRLAKCRPNDADQPGEGDVDTRAAGDRLVLRDCGGAVSDPGHARRRSPALPRRPGDVLRTGSGPPAALQPGPHLARATRAVLDGGLLAGGIFLARSSPGASRAAKAGWPMACSSPSPSSSLVH